MLRKRLCPFFIDQHYRVEKVLPFAFTGGAKSFRKSLLEMCLKAAHVNDRRFFSKFLFNFIKLCYDAHLEQDVV